MEPSQKTEFCLRGIGCAPGVARGKAFVFLQRDVELPCYKLDDSLIDSEIARFDAAVEKTREQLNLLSAEMRARANEPEAEIFDAHLLVLDDPAVIGETEKAIKSTRINAEHCFNSVTARYIEFFSGLEDAYLKERAADIRDVAQRVLRNLLGKTQQHEGPDRFAERIIVAEELTPSETLAFEKSSVSALLTDAGNHTSHAAIMARSLGIPAVVGLRIATLRIAQDDDVLVDGEKGLVYINPSERTLDSYARISLRRSRLEIRIAEENVKPDLTADGTPFKIEGNISGKEDMEKFRQAHIDDVGLFRSEGIFLRTDRFPPEEMQYEEYRQVVEMIPPRNSIIIRTLDIGGDKHISGSLLPPEDNPFMGFRAIRFCLEFKDIFKDQLRAILRTSVNGNVKILLPMISSIAEVVAAKEVIEDAKSELRSRNVPFDEDIQIGSMIEVPAAVAIAEELADEVDFFSIGTNDLTQYMLAVDRGNEKISHLYDSYHPSVIRAIARTIRAAKSAEIPCTVCGELAGDPCFAPLLLGLGASALSMNPASAPRIRYILRHTTMQDVNKLAHAVIHDANPRSIQERLTIFINSILPVEM
ncbi:MAG: phosphoenolpyruvate--protein phosphotransferase [Opitutae bacterium]|nr:phosphoenolpyruvate--protein phosphotransferase [Opitutae bacterium]